MKKPAPNTTKKPRATKPAGSATKNRRKTANANPPPDAQVRVIRLDYHDPAAAEVIVAGSFNDWHTGAIPLKRRDDGSWSVELRLEPGHHEYRFVVDGQWRDDPRADRTTMNPYGGVNGVIEIPPGAV